MSNTNFYCTEARSRQTRDDVYRIRYECYRRDNSIDSNPAERFSDAFDDSPNHFSYLLGSAEEALATVRISVVRPDLNWTDSPAQHVYGDCPALQSIASESYVEASRLCFAPQARTNTFISLLGNMAALAEFYSVRWLVACPRAEQAPVYERLFGFSPLAEPRVYHGVRFKTQLLAVSLDRLRTHIQHDRPLFPSWASALAQASEQAPIGELVAA